MKKSKILGCTAAMMLTIPLVSNAQDYWWAVAMDYIGYSHGASWNYTSRGEAEEVALKEFRQRSSKPSECEVVASNRNSCFYITEWLGPNRSTQYSHGTNLGRGFSSKAAVMKHYHRQQEPGRDEPLEMLECAGV